MARDILLLRRLEWFNIRIVAGITVLSLFLLAGSAGAVPAEEWNRTFGGTGDYYATSVQQASDGGYILSGYTGALGNGDYAWLRKTGIDGLEIWNKTFRKETINVVYSVQQIQDGYMLTGYTGPNLSYSSAWLIKTDSNGNERWNRTYGENIYSWAYSVHQTSDGGYILAGRMRPQRFGSWTEADFDAYLIKTDASGNEQWNRTLGGKYRDEARSVSKTRDGGYILAGMSNSFGSYWGYAWQIRMDKDGNEKWNRTYSMSSSIYSDVSSVLETSDGGYILAGVILLNESGKDAWLIKTDKNGNEQWNKTFSGKGNDGASSVQQTADGGYILAGSPTDAGAQTAWLVKTDANGNEQWNLTFGGKFNAYSVAQTADGGYILAGDTFLPGADGRVAWLIKVRGVPAEKAPGFESVLAIAILLAAFAAIWKRR